MYPLANNLFFSKQIIFLCAFLLLGFVNSVAQNVSAPYSIIGIGDIENSNFNRTSGMANTGIAYHKSNYLILNNPAAVSDLQDQFFFMDVASRGKFVTFSGKSLTENVTGKDFSIERLSIGTKLNKWWGSSVGFLPFSTSNYAFSGTKSLLGSNITFPVEYEGSGGVNKYFFTNGFKIAKNFSIGITTSFLGGSLKQQDSLLSSDLNAALVTTKNIYFRNWYFNFGFQYHLPVSKKWEIDLGATYA